MRCGRGILVKLFGNALDFEAFTFFREQEPFQQGNFQISTNLIPLQLNGHLFCIEINYKERIVTFFLRAKKDFILNFFYIGNACFFQASQTFFTRK